MEVFLFFIIFFPLNLWLAKLTSAKGDWLFLTRVITIAWILFIPLLAAVNIWMPFSDSGDDHTYFVLADPPIKSITQAFDFTRFMGEMEQPGYPWLLSFLNGIIGYDLLTFKALNFFFLILLSLTWYRIGLVLAGPKFARSMVVLILFLTPLWFYVFILRKDIIITLLQSLYLLTAIHIWIKPVFRMIFIALLLTSLLILFRTPLILQNLGVLVAGVSLKIFGQQVGSNRFLPLVLSLISTIILVAIGSNPEIMFLFGIYSEHRILGTSEFIGSVDLYTKGVTTNRTLFPLLYLFSETAGFSPQSWAILDSSWLRGILALPWIFFGVPFFIIGLFFLFKPKNVERSRRGIVSRFRASWLVSTPWSLILIFVASSILISWILGDTTRWRIPDFPMVAAIALAGRMYTKKRIRRQILLAWLTVMPIFFILYYVIQSS